MLASWQEPTTSKRTETGISSNPNPTPHQDIGTSSPDNRIWQASGRPVLQKHLREFQCESIVSNPRLNMAYADQSGFDSCERGNFEA